MQLAATIGRGIASGPVKQSNSSRESVSVVPHSSITMPSSHFRLGHGSRAVLLIDSAHNPYIPHDLWHRTGGIKHVSAQNRTRNYLPSLRDCNASCWCWSPSQSPRAASAKLFRRAIGRPGRVTVESVAASRPGPVSTGPSSATKALRRRALCAFCLRTPDI